MLSLIAAIALAAVPLPPAPPCRAQSGCVQASAAQLFDLAEQLYAKGEKAAAAEVLEGLSHDKHPELRAEARFRLAAVLESQGNLKGAVQVLRALLAEQPDANRARLELARILERMGNGAEAKTQLAQAVKLGLPPQVEQNVRRYAAAISSTKRRGLTLEMTAGPDSNINRSTSSQFIDTIVAPFQLDPDARKMAGDGFTTSARGYSRDPIGRIDLLSQAAVRADLYNVGRFNDVQLSLYSGPEFSVGAAKLRAAAVYERRWFGNRPFSDGVGADVDATLPLSSRTQLALTASTVRQRISPNPQQDGWRSFADADLVQAIGSATLARVSLRYGRLDARARPESLRQLGGGLLIARQTRPVTLFAGIDYTRTHGIAPVFLFGKTRRDERWDVNGGVIMNTAKLGGFSPIMRIAHTGSSANIALFDYRRTRIDFGVTGSF